jgi:hypothetical protein
MKKFTRTPNGKLTPKPLLEPPKSQGYTPGAEVKIEFGISKCKFLTPYPRPLDNALSAQYPGYVFAPSFKAGHWDGTHRFITRAGYFPTGLLPVVVHILKTGNNPLIDPDKKEYMVLKNPAKSVVIVPTKVAQKYYYPGLENFYENEIQLLDYFSPETGEFVYPKDLLKNWSEVKNSNELAGKILAFAKELFNHANQ